MARHDARAHDAEALEYPDRAEGKAENSENIENDFHEFPPAKKVAWVNINKRGREAKSRFSRAPGKGCLHFFAAAGLSVHGGQYDLA